MPGWPANAQPITRNAMSYLPSLTRALAHIAATRDAQPGMALRARNTLSPIVARFDQDLENTQDALPAILTAHFRIGGRSGLTHRGG